MHTPSAPLGALLADVEVIELDGEPDVAIEHITHDSRLVMPGSLFVAYQGVYEDVHRFLPDALARGAAAALVERTPAALRAELDLPAGVPIVQVRDARLARAQAAAAMHGHPSRDLDVVGITGTDGKTTTATLVHAILGAAGRRAGLVSTVQADLGAQTIETGLHVTTPEPEDLQAYLAGMRDAGLEIAVLEVTSHGLAQHRVGALAFDVAVMTNITHEALEYHGTFEAYRDAKAMLFHSLIGSPRRPGVPKTAVLNVADASFAVLDPIPVDQRLTYSVAGAADFAARHIQHAPSGLTFTAATPRGDVELRSPLLGAYNAANILAAMAATSVLGAGPSDWQAGVAAVRGIPGRMELVDAGQSFVAIVDFAHTPNALRHALATAHELVGPAGRVISVFGCAGLRDPGKRVVMGRAAGELADLTVVTAEDPRTEDLSQIIDAVADGLRDAGAHEGRDYHIVPDRGAAIRRAVAEAHAGDVVIVCGKGHEQSMCFGDTEYAWDDRSALRAALDGTPYGDLPTANAR